MVNLIPFPKPVPHLSIVAKAVSPCKVVQSAWRVIGTPKNDIVGTQMNVSNNGAYWIWHNQLAAVFGALAGIELQLLPYPHSIAAPDRLAFSARFDQGRELRLKVQGNHR